jgi:hypothetical protein
MGTDRPHRRTLRTDTPYGVLGLATDATEVEIRRAFRRAALATHPDRGGDRDRFEIVHGAYAALRRDSGPTCLHTDKVPAEDTKQAAPVRSTPVRSTPVRPAQVRSATVRSTAGRVDPYARMMADLEAAAAIVVTPRARPPLVDIKRATAQVTSPLAETATAFRRVLERELERLVA